MSSDTEAPVSILDPRIEDYQRQLRALLEEVRFLDRERQRLSAVVSHSGAGFIIVDASARVVWANEMSRNRLGGAQTLAMLTGHHRDALAEPFRTRKVAHREMNLDVYGRIRHFYVTATPILTPEGQVEECLVMLQDVSDLRILRASEDALRTSEDRFRSIFENVGAGMYTCTAQGRSCRSTRRSASYWITASPS